MDSQWRASLETDEIFLFVRLIANKVYHMFFEKLEDVLVELGPTIVESSNDVEWNEVDQLYARWLRMLHASRRLASSKSPTIMRWLDLYDMLLLQRKSP